MRRLFYLLMSIGLLFYALPSLSVTHSIKQTIFSLAWMFFALCTIGGNLFAFLYLNEKKKVQNIKQKGMNYQRQRSVSH